VAQARELLASKPSPSVRAAAAAVGVARSTLQRWLDEDQAAQEDQDVEDAVAEVATASSWLALG
jgi:transposase-like protein